jgi:hypothetical protein
MESLTFEQSRVLGCLIEKELTTPDYYPLTLNALVTACNQTSNREPVVALDERTVLEALEGLKRRRFVVQVTLAGARTQKYKHDLKGVFPRLGTGDMALLAVLMLRGPQTAGELRTRTERMHPYADLPAVEAALQRLAAFPDETLVVMFPSGEGRRVPVWAHLFCGAVATPAPPASSPRPESAPADPDWRTRMEREIAALRAEVAALRQLVGGSPAAETPFDEPGEPSPPVG